MKATVGKAVAIDGALGSTGVMLRCTRPRFLESKIASATEDDDDDGEDDDDNADVMGKGMDSFGVDAADVAMSC